MSHPLGLPRPSAPRAHSSESGAGTRVNWALWRIGRLKLLYILRGGRAERLALPDGQYPDEFFYGYRQLARRPGWQVELRERATSWAPGRALQRLVHAFTHLSPDFGGARELSPAMLSQYDAVISTSEPVLMMLALRRRSRGAGARLVLILMGAEKRIERSRVPAVTRRVLRWALGQMDAVIVIGEGERGYVLDEGLTTPERVHLVHFGVDTGFWTPKSGEVEGPILAVGNDDGRDYALLLRSIGPHPLRLHTRLPVGNVPSNVTLSGGTWQDAALSDEALRDLYRACRFVVVPLRDSTQPQGQSVTLQAMACSKAVVLSHTRGTWGSGLIRHGENCHLVEAGDAAGLREAIETLSADAAYRERLGAAARLTVQEHFTSGRMAEEIATVVQATRP
jgi:glycosyl transferase family 1/glycosyl transferase family 4